jgi:hypothetical protein
VTWCISGGRSGVDGWPGKSLLIGLHSEDGVVEGRGRDVQSEHDGASTRICWENLET